MRGFLKSVLLVVLVLAVGSCGSAGRVPIDPVQAQVRPNILFVLTDDQDAASLAEMPKVQELLVGRGTTFDRAFVTTALCCPSRATTLRSHVISYFIMLYSNEGFIPIYTTTLISR